MGLQVYLSEKELSAVLDSATEWSEIMSSGDSTSLALVEERMDDGLGSALYKLYKGKNGQQAYKQYAKMNDK